jgi:hypothetical protein
MAECECAEGRKVPLKRYTARSFKAEFKVGDTIHHCTTRKLVTITAMGIHRFLCVDHRGREGVATMEDVQGYKLHRRG